MEGFRGHDLACIRSERIVFEDLRFSVAPGDALVLTGPNGSGKSSLLRIMAGISRPAAGEISWRGRPVSVDPESFFGAIHYLGHKDAVKPALSVRENLGFQARIRGVHGDIDGALERVGLAALADMPARLLSAGQARRLSLARLFASPAALWLLDEPTVALDGPSVETVCAEIAAHRNSGGMVVASTNVPLAIDGAATLDVSRYAARRDALWGAAETEPGAPS